MYMFGERKKKVDYINNNYRLDGENKKFYARMK